MKNKLIVKYTYNPLRQFNEFFLGNKDPWDYKIILVTPENKEEILYSEIGFKTQPNKDSLPFKKIIEKIGYWKFLKVLFPGAELIVENLNYKKGEIELKFKNIPEDLVYSKYNPSFSKFSDPCWLKDWINWNNIEKNLEIEYNSISIDKEK